jgi:CBS domain-containing protein
MKVAGRGRIQPLPKEFNMPISRFIKKGVVAAELDQNIEEVADLMKEHDVGAVLVLNNDESPAGIITDRDIVLRCVSEGADCSEVKAEEVMTEAVDTVDIDDGLMDVINCMKESGVRRVPVVDEDGKAVALVSFGDVLELLVTELSALTGPATPEKKKIDKEAA